MKLSIVIPVYNEEIQIAGCLDAIAAQTIKPDEVIVIDNNCTDKTIKIARSYNFVSVVKEEKQGRGYARTTGFNSAEGQIIGRIDADSRIAKNWVERVKNNFEKDANLSGLTGIANADVIPYFHRIKSTLMSRSYFWFAHAGFNTITMWGANMAIKKSAWEEIASYVCLDDSKVHEDQDLSIWMASKGLKIKVDNDLRITTKGQTYRYLPKLLKYSKLYLNTKKIHIENYNLKSDRLIKLGFWPTLPGRIAAFIISITTLIISIVLFPLDYILLHLLKKTEFLK